MARSKGITSPIVETKQDEKERNRALMTKELITLDFVEHDAIAALKYLITIFEENKAAGIVFAVAMKHERTSDHLFGACGRTSANLVEAVGMAALLQRHLLSHCPN